MAWRAGRSGPGRSARGLRCRADISSGQVSQSYLIKPRLDASTRHHKWTSGRFTERVVFLTLLPSAPCAPNLCVSALTRTFEDHLPLSLGKHYTVGAYSGLGNPVHVRGRRYMWCNGRGGGQSAGTARIGPPPQTPRTEDVATTSPLYIFFHLTSID